MVKAPKPPFADRFARARHAFVGASVGIAIGFAHSSAFAENRQADLSDRLVSAWESWVSAGDHPASTLAILIDGTDLRTEAKGTPPDTALPLASLSKALTAECARAIGLSDSDRAGPLLGLELDVPEPTLGELVTHTAGLWPDSTQNNPAFAPDAEGASQRALVETSLQREREADRIGASHYNNENYAVIGAMIAAKTGRPYEQACREGLFGPLGLQTPTMEHRWGHHGPWGGWALSAADYARFVQATFGPGSKFATEPATFAAAPIDARIKTVTGANWWASPDGPYVWATGLLCWGDAGNGGYFASYGGDVIVVVLFEGCVADASRLGALDGALFRAAHPQD